jgi:hypothetical protein
MRELQERCAALRARRLDDQRASAVTAVHSSALADGSERELTICVLVPGWLGSVDVVVGGGFCDAVRLLCL